MRASAVSVGIVVEEKGVTNCVVHHATIFLNPSMHARKGGGPDGAEDHCMISVTLV